MSRRPMLSLRPLTMAGFLVLFSGRSVYSADVIPPSQAPTDPWVASNYLQIVDRLLGPLDTRAGTFPREIRWYVSVQIVSPALPEEEWTLKKFEDDSVRAEVRRPTGGSVTSLVTRLHAENPELSASELASQLPITTTEFSSLDCPDLQRVAKHFESLRIGLSPVTGLSMHGTRYRFITAHWSGYFLEGVISGDERLLVKQKEPVAAWTERLRRALRGCTASAHAGELTP